MKTYYIADAPSSEVVKSVILLYYKTSEKNLSDYALNKINIDNLGTFTKEYIDSINASYLIATVEGGSVEFDTTSWIKDRSVDTDPNYIIYYDYLGTPVGYTELDNLGIVKYQTEKVIIEINITITNEIRDLVKTLDFNDHIIATSHHTAHGALLVNVAINKSLIDSATQSESFSKKLLRSNSRTILYNGLINLDNDGRLYQLTEEKYKIGKSSDGFTPVGFTNLNTIDSLDGTSGTERYLVSYKEVSDGIILRLSRTYYTEELRVIEGNDKITFTMTIDKIPHYQVFDKKVSDYKLLPTKDYIEYTNVLLDKEKLIGSNYLIAYSNTEEPKLVLIYIDSIRHNNYSDEVSLRRQLDALIESHPNHRLALPYLPFSNSNYELIKEKYVSDFIPQSEVDDINQRLDDIKSTAEDIAEGYYDDPSIINIVKIPITKTNGDQFFKSGNELSYYDLNTRYFAHMNQDLDKLRYQLSNLFRIGKIKYLYKISNTSFIYKVTTDSDNRYDYRIANAHGEFSLFTILKNEGIKNGDVIKSLLLIGDDILLTISISGVEKVFFLESITNGFNITLLNPGGYIVGTHRFNKVSNNNIIPCLVSDNNFYGLQENEGEQYLLLL